MSEAKKLGVKKMSVAPGLSFYFVIGKWGGFVFQRSANGVRLVMGFFAISILTFDFEAAVEYVERKCS